MAAPNDHETAQRIFKVMEEQREVLKKMRSHLTKLEKVKLKNATHMEIHNDDEGEVRMKEIRPNMKETSNLRSSQRTPWP